MARKRDASTTPKASETTSTRATELSSDVDNARTSIAKEVSESDPEIPQNKTKNLNSIKPAVIGLGTSRKQIILSPRWYDRWPISGESILKHWRSASDPVVEIERFLWVNASFEGQSYVGYILFIHRFMEDLRQRDKRSADRLFPHFRRWTRKFMGWKFTNDLKALISPKLDSITRNGFLEEWWDGTTTFLTLAYKVIHTDFGYVTPNRLELWIQAVESVRQCYYLAHGCYEMVASEVHRGTFVNDVRTGAVARWKPWRAFEAGLLLPQQHDNSDIDTLTAKLSQYTQKLLEDVQKPTDPWQDIKSAYEILKDIDAYREISGPVGQLDHAELAADALQKWAQAKDYGVHQYFIECEKSLDHLAYKDNSLEAIEAYFEQMAVLVERLDFIGDYFLSEAATKNFKATVHAYLMDFRNVRYPQYSEISRIWYTIWRILDILYTKDRPSEEETEQLPPHKALDFRFLRAEAPGFQGMRGDQLFTRRAMHLLIGHYCDTVIEAIQTTLYDSWDGRDGNLLGHSDMLDDFLKETDKDGHAVPDTNEDFHVLLHQLTSRLISACRKEGFHISATGHNRAEQWTRNVSEEGIKLPDLPDDLLRKVFAAQPLERYSRTITPSDPISSSPPRLFSSAGEASSQGTSPLSQHGYPGVKKAAAPTTTANTSDATVWKYVIPTGQPSNGTSQIDNATIRNQPHIYNAAVFVAKPPTKAPYMRLIPGNGQYLMGETAAISKAIGQQIARDLVEPGLDASTDPIEVDCKVQHPFQLPGISHPAGLYDATRSTSERRSTWLWARDLFNRFTFGRREEPITLNSPRFPGAVEYQVLKRVIKSPTKAFKPVRLGHRLEKVRSNHTWSQAMRRLDVENARREEEEQRNPRPKHITRVERRVTGPPHFTGAGTVDPRRESDIKAPWNFGSERVIQNEINKRKYTQMDPQLPSKKPKLIRKSSPKQPTRPQSPRRLQNPFSQTEPYSSVWRDPEGRRGQNYTVTDKGSPIPIRWTLPSSIPSSKSLIGTRPIPALPDNAPTSPDYGPPSSDYASSSSFLRAPPVTYPEIQAKRSKLIADALKLPRNSPLRARIREELRYLRNLARYKKGQPIISSPLRPAPRQENRFPSNIHDTSLTSRSSPTEKDRMEAIMKNLETSARNEKDPQDKKAMMRKAVEIRADLLKMDAEAKGKSAADVLDEAKIEYTEAAARATKIEKAFKELKRTLGEARDTTQVRDAESSARLRGGARGARDTYLFKTSRKEDDLWPTVDGEGLYGSAKQRPGPVKCRRHPSATQYTINRIDMDEDKLARRRERARKLQAEKQRSSQLPEPTCTLPPASNFEPISPPPQGPIPTPAHLSRPPSPSEMLAQLEAKESDLRAELAALEKRGTKKHLAKLRKQIKRTEEEKAELECQKQQQNDYPPSSPPSDLTPSERLAELETKESKLRAKLAALGKQGMKNPRTPLRKWIKDIEERKAKIKREIEQDDEFSDQQEASCVPSDNESDQSILSDQQDGSCIPSDDERRRIEENAAKRLLDSFTNTKKVVQKPTTTTTSASFSSSSSSFPNEEEAEGEEDDEDDDYVQEDDEEEEEDEIEMEGEEEGEEDEDDDNGGDGLQRLLSDCRRSDQALLDKLNSGEVRKDQGGRRGGRKGQKKTS